jgi:uncharacterized protein YcbK (DUF882 family)
MNDYFPESDFLECSPPCRKSDMKPDTLKRFNAAREIAGIPFNPTSAFRTVEHEKRMNRPGTSAHTTGHAMDIACTNDNARMKIVQALLKAGFTRIGIAKTFVHADDSPHKTQNIIWNY